MAATDMRPIWGRRIRQIRRERELTVTEVAERVGISRGYLHEIERGTYAPSDELGDRIASAIGVDPDAIFNYDLSDAS